VAQPTATSPCPISFFEALLAAESKGAFFNRNVRNRFPYQRLA
jgi:hypothetical protein